MELTAEPIGKSWEFSVFREGGRIATVDAAWAGEQSGERRLFAIGTDSYEVSRVVCRTGGFVLECGEEVLAQAQRPSLFIPSFHVRCGRRHFELRVLAASGRCLGLFEQNREVGRIQFKGRFDRRATIELSDELGVPIAVFVFWLVLVLRSKVLDSVTPAEAIASE